VVNTRRTRLIPTSDLLWVDLDLPADLRPPGARQHGHCRQPVRQERLQVGTPRPAAPASCAALSKASAGAMARASAVSSA
jgi:hypothetical protein